MVTRQSGDDSKVAVSRDKKSGKRGGCGFILFFTIFFLVGSALLFFLFIKPVAGVIDARDWPAVPCTILTSKVEMHPADSADDSDTYSIEITYRYQFEEKTYESDRYHFFDVSSSGRQGKQKVVDRYQAGTQAECFVDPDDPTSAVLHRGWSLDLLWGLFGLPFLLVGGGGLLYTAGLLGKGKSKTSPADWRSTAAADESLRSIRGGPLGGSHGGPGKLKAKTSPMGNFIATTFAMLFWNGIVSVFLTFVVQGFRDGEGPWCIAIFLIPFVLIGLLLIFATGVAFLKLFNPRPTVAISDTHVPLGGTLELAWKFKGQTRSIRRLKIELIGSEHATYRRGTSVHTDQEQFAAIPIYETSNFLNVGGGETSVTVPADTMHTFTAVSNKIQWNLKLTGEIAWWPDVEEFYPITVLPK